jgi:predicted nucleic acid-binding protein
MQATVQLFSLHAGEIQALNIAKEYQANLFLTDDTAARLAAGAISISVHGTLGILLRAIRRKQRTAENILAVLESIPSTSSLHLKTSLLQGIIEQVNQLIQSKS